MSTTQPFDRNDINNLEALSFDSDIVYRTVQELMPGLERYLITNSDRDLPSRNSLMERIMLARIGQTFAGIRDEIQRMKANQAASMWEENYVIGYDDMTQSGKFLPFSNVSGIITRPQEETGYQLFKSGSPLTNGISCVLVPGVGIQFTDAWVSGQSGQLFVLGAGYAAARKIYAFYGASFEGAGHRTANLVSIGADLLGRAISPLPTVATQIRVYKGTLLTNTISYTFAVVGGEPIITFLQDVDSGQIVQIEVLGSI